MSALSIQIGPLFDRYGSRILLLVGSILQVLTFFLLAECTKYWHFMLVYGLIGGIAGALISTVALAVLAHWFDKRRGLASGITFVGSSICGIMFSLTLRETLVEGQTDALGWKWSARILGFIILFLMTVGNLTIRERLPSRKDGAMINLKVSILRN